MSEEFIRSRIKWHEEQTKRLPDPPKREPKPDSEYSIWDDYYEDNSGNIHRRAFSLRRRGTES